MTPSLDDLPVELVERIVDYLPHRETLLHLRLVSPNLNVKLTRRFCKTYFTSSNWRLKSTSSKAIVHFSRCPDVVAHLTSVTLTAPCANHASYDNIWTAKSIEPAKMARALSLFTEVKTLQLINFGSIQGLMNTTAFFQPFVLNLYLPKLQTLHLLQVDIQADDAIQLLKKHGQTIKRVELDRVNLLYLPDTDTPKYETPWFDLLYSMREFKNHCSVSIEWAKQDGRTAQLEPPWENWSFTLVDEFIYKRMCIEMVPDDPEDEDLVGDTHVRIEVPANKDWWDCVSRLAAFNIFSITIGGWGVEDLDNRMWEWSDEDWDGQIAQCLKIKARKAAKRKEKAAAALRKQKKEGLEAAMMHGQLKK